MGTTLLGRDDEWARLRTALDAGFEIGVVAGAGQGLSAFLTAAAEDALARGHHVVHMAGHRDEHDHEGAALQQLIWPLRAAVAGILTDDDRSAVTAAATLRPRAGQDLAAALADGAHRLLAAPGRTGPLLIVVDDLHLCDPLSARVLRDLGRRTYRNPVVFLLGVRRHRAADLLWPGMCTIELGPLPDVDAARLLDRQAVALSGRARLRLLDRARGKPRAIVELAAAFDGAPAWAVLQPPPSRSDPLRQRHAADLAGLDPATLALARQVSAQLTDEDVTAVLAASGVPEEVLTSAVASGLLETDGRTVRFADPAAGVAAYLSCSALERAALHDRFAAVLPGAPHRTATAPETTTAGPIAAAHQAAAAAGPSEPIATALERAADRVTGPDRRADTLAWAAELSPDPADAARRYSAAALTAGRPDWVLELHAAAEAHGGATRDATVQAVLALCRSGRTDEAADLANDPDAAYILDVYRGREPDEADSRLGFPELFLPRAGALINAGRWAAADAVLTEAENLSHVSGLAVLAAEVATLRAVLAGLRGDRAAARLRPVMRPTGRLVAWVHEAQGLAEFADGNHERAYQHFRDFFDPGGHGRHLDPYGRMLSFLALTAVWADRVGDAGRVMDAAGASEQVRALLNGDLRPAALDAAGPLEGALAHLQHGIRLRRDRRIRPARVELSTALAAFEDLGAAGFADTARNELRAAGADPAKPVAAPGATDPLDRLSPQQRNVVLLAARGLRNQEIASRLNLSMRTIGTHLHHAYPKLGVGGRHELAAMLDAG
ncbi:helix-turn-helix transcriptional regulator [Paractinoplanes atraurantiacus]|uniref:AAA ATPase domain-containing protein n=1 Tax=Paractinoplanes atraurantiacus TaxID=1036182 RepID=A0A285J0A3_9ACTN|nr:LuxR family transcriptional regulator [Actinoplanes atraurantiacus]SNY53662.1 AAA ATPase domain-containing protein [Actinoplanes atraurantiacus]